jgi:hypothetical protein
MNDETADGQTVLMNGRYWIKTLFDIYYTVPATV